MNLTDLVNVCRESTSRSEAYAAVLEANGDRHISRVDFKNLLFIFAAIDKLVDPDIEE